MRNSWTDERLDHLNTRMDERFDQMDQRFERIESDIREIRSEVSEGFKSMHRLMFHGVIALSAAIVAGFGGMAGLLAVVA